MTPFSAIWPQLAEKYNRLSDRLDWPRLRARLSPVLGGITDRFFRDVEMGEGWELPERPEIRVWLRVPAGSELSKLDELMRPFEQRANESPAVKRTLIQISRREARMTVLFEEEALDSEAPLRLREEMIGQAAGLAGVDISVSGLAPTGFHSGLGRVSGHTVLAIGPNYENLDLLVKNFAARLSRRPRVAGVDVEAGPDDAAAAREVVRIAWGAEASARTGISTAQLAQTLQAGLWRQTPDFHAQVDGIARVPIRVVHEKIEGQDLERLTQRPLVVEGGKVIRLDEHSEISLSKDPPTIERINQRYRRTLRVYYRGDYESGEEMLGQEIEAEPLAPGYVLERPSPGAFQDLASSRKWGVLLGAIALVFLTVAAALESWRRAAVVVLTVPFAWIGIAAAFLLTAQNFTEGAFLGLVLVVGIGVNDSILLVDTFHRLRRRKGRLPAKKSALLALRQRLRPMWLTTLTSIAGMVPILVSANGVHFWQGLATTVIGGLLASTVLGPAVTLALLGLGQKGTDSGPGLG
ncbi:MAG: efflux RND transporter permease subunit [Acidobacteriota bacterium]